jgi:nucleoside-diphosphate-sugar epimerase
LTTSSAKSVPTSDEPSGLLSGSRVFLTGGRGFIGSHFVARFLGRRNAVTVFDNGRRDALAYSGLDGNADLRSIKGDVTDRAALGAAIGDASHVLHLAAIAGVSSYYRSPLRTLEVNYGGTENLLSCLKDRPGVELIVGLSTSEIYGPEARDAREDGRTSQGSIWDRRWVYAISKLAAEKLAYAYHWEHGLPICWIRPFNVYGPGQVGEGAVSKFVFRALHGLPLQVTGDGQHVRAFCYIDDFCEAIETCLSIPDAARGQSFNIGDPREPVTMLDLARRIVALTHSRSEIVFIPHAGEDVIHRSPSIERAGRMLGYEPRCQLDEGLRRTIDWFREMNPAEPT